jgi:hypothetical protein
MFSTLQSAKHFVRTGYGDSTGYYIGSSFPKPMHGIGQGNGGGPIIWAVLSSPILNLMRASGYGAEFICPLSMVKTSFGGYAFIDDTDLVVAKLSFLTYIKVAHALQSSMTLWEKRLSKSNERRHSTRKSIRIHHGLRMEGRLLDLLTVPARIHPPPLSSRISMDSLNQLNGTKYGRPKRLSGYILHPTEILKPNSIKCYRK